MANFSKSATTGNPIDVLILISAIQKLELVCYSQSLLSLIDWVFEARTFILEQTSRRKLQLCFETMNYQFISPAYSILNFRVSSLAWPERLISSHDFIESTFKTNIALIKTQWRIKKGKKNTHFCGGFPAETRTKKIKSWDLS